MGKVTKKYLVIVKHPVSKPPSQREGSGLVQAGQSSQAWTVAKPNTIKEVVANDYEGAAEMVGVPAGATVHVILMEHVKTFKRPETAPLVAA